MQRKLDPKIVGYYIVYYKNLLMLLKEYILLTQANMIFFLSWSNYYFKVFIIGIITWPKFGLINVGLILYILAISSLSTYGVLLAR